MCKAVVRESYPCLPAIRVMIGQRCELGSAPVLALS
jgi:hypothetical protein